MASETNATPGPEEEANRFDWKPWRGLRTAEVRSVIDRIVGGAQRILPGRTRKIDKELDDVRRGFHEVKRDFELIRLYHDYRKSGKRETVDDRSWSDLEMDEVFSRIDRTVSPIGRQCLYATMRTYEDDTTELERRSRDTALFRKDAGLRRAVRRVLYRLRDRDVLYLVSMFFEDLPGKPKLCGLIYASSGLFFLSIGLSLFRPGFLFAAAAMALVNLGISAVYGRVVLEHFEQFSQLTTMLGAVRELASLAPEEPIAELGRLKDRSGLARRINRKISWLCIDESRLNDLASAFVLLLNLFGLLKLVMFLLSLDHLRHCRNEMREMYEAIGALDARISVASYLESIRVWTTPSFDGASGMEVTGIYHPLVDNAVPNSFALERGAALITGSNLAGKTTFIKTIGVNLILARTLFFCHAEKAHLPRAVVRTSISQDERVTDGQSYYSREVDRIRGFFECPPGRFLFLIDEIFRGTNTAERIVIAAATIRHLSANNIVLVTTHDIELEGLLKDSSRMFHFSEQIEGERYYFDYVLRPGACLSGNAIRLLELRGYPADLVSETRRLASLRCTQGNSR